MASIVESNGQARQRQEVDTIPTLAWSSPCWPPGVRDDELVPPGLRRRDPNRTVRSGRVVLSDFRAGGVVDEKVHVGILRAIGGGLELFPRRERQEISDLSLAAGLRGSSRSRALGSAQQLGSGDREGPQRWSQGVGGSNPKLVRREVRAIGLRQRGNGR